MRTRKEIENEHYDAYCGMGSGQTATMVNTRFMLEVLLDIRDLLANPPLEITGEPLHALEVKKEV